MATFKDSQGNTVSEVDITRHVLTGTPIATINGKTIYAPNSGGGGDTGALDIAVFGDNYIGVITAAASTVMNSWVTDARIVGGKKIWIGISSDNTDLTGTIVNVYVSAGGSYSVIGQVKINGSNVEMTVPSNVSNNKLLFQTSSASWTSNISVAVLICFAKGLVERTEILETNALQYNEYATVATFEEIAVIGDSYSSGAIYGVTGVTDGRHDGVSWLKVMARRNGCEGTLYTKPGLTTGGWLSEKLQDMLSDTAKNLYFVMLGINAESNYGSIADCHNDWTQNADTFCGNYGKIIGNVKTHAPSAKIVCVKPPMTSDSTKQLIAEVAAFYGVVTLDTMDDEYFSSSFYKGNLPTSHPIAVTYGGMAIAYERLFSRCVQNNVSYFEVYQGND